MLLAFTITLHHPLFSGEDKVIGKYYDNGKYIG